MGARELSRAPDQLVERQAKPNAPIARMRYGCRERRVRVLTGEVAHFARIRARFVVAPADEDVVVLVLDQAVAHVGSIQERERPSQLATNGVGPDTRNCASPCTAPTVHMATLSGPYPSAT